MLIGSCLATEPAAAYSAARNVNIGLFHYEHPHSSNSSAHMYKLCIHCLSMLGTAVLWSSLKQAMCMCTLYKQTCKSCHNPVLYVYMCVQDSMPLKLVFVYTFLQVNM